MGHITDTLLITTLPRLQVQHGFNKFNKGRLYRNC